jgi:hypothetical protein
MKEENPKSGLKQGNEQEIKETRSSAKLMVDFNEELDGNPPPGYMPAFVVVLRRFIIRNQNSGSSESLQAAHILEACNRIGWPTPTCIMPCGVSALAKGENGITNSLDPKSQELRRFIAAAEVGQVPAGTLLIVDVDIPDRFLRTNLDAVQHALMTLLRNGVSILFLSVPVLLEAGSQANVDIWEKIMFLSNAPIGKTKSRLVRRIVKESLDQIPLKQIVQHLSAIRGSGNKRFQCLR